MAVAELWYDRSSSAPVRSSAKCSLMGNLLKLLHLEPLLSKINLKMQFSVSLKPYGIKNVLIYWNYSVRTTSRGLLRRRHTSYVPTSCQDGLFDSLKIGRWNSKIEKMQHVRCSLMGKFPSQNHIYTWINKSKYSFLCLWGLSMG